MLIADSTARALENVAARERDLLRAFPADAQFDAAHGAQLPCEAPQDAYFITRDETGRRLFLRGNLFMNGGTLTDGNGRPVLGYKAANGALQPLHADAVDVSLGFAQDAAIGSDGTVSYGRSTIDPLTGNRRLQYITIGRLALARFPAGTRLTDSDPAYAAAPAGIVPHVGVPGDGSFPPLQSPSLMSRDAELDSGLQRLQEAYLALDALRAAGAAQGSVQKTAMDLLK